MSPSERSWRRAWWASLALAAVVAAVIVWRFIAFRLSLPQPAPFADPTAALRRAGCSLQTFPSQGRVHVDRVPTGFHYASFPPTSGPHARKPAAWGAYGTPQPELELIHNLEHGGIVIQYGDGVANVTKQALVRWWRRDRNAMVVAPLPRLGRTITLSAWTRLARCPRFDASAFAAFRNAYRYRGPERRPVDELRPGGKSPN